MIYMRNIMSLGSSETPGDSNQTFQNRLDKWFLSYKASKKENRKFPKTWLNP
jgi:hypothetical protein